VPPPPGCRRRHAEVWRCLAGADVRLVAAARSAGRIDAAVAQLQAEGHEIREEDITRLSPLKHRNLNLLGRYSFTASTPAAGALRPLRDPDAPELDEDDEGVD
jgi:hypothetical protein